MKEKIRKECYLRVRAILKAQLNPANWDEAIDMSVIPVVTLSFNIVNWMKPEDGKSFDIQQNVSLKGWCWQTLCFEAL